MGALVPLDTVSRRRFVNTGVASFLLPAALARAQDLPDPEATKIEAGQDASSHLTINVMINGKGPFNFVVDTGADRSVIAEDVAVTLGLLRQKQVMVEGVVRTIPAQTAHLDNLAFGPVSRDNLNVPILPRLLLGSDGYLGLDAISGYRVTFDFKKHMLEIALPRNRMILTRSILDEVRVPVVGRSGHLRSLNCRADGIYTTTFIDTGAEVSVGNQRLLEALAEKNPTYLKPGKVPLTGITGGVVNGSFTTVKSLHMGELVFDGCNIVIADLQIFRLWGLSDTPALLIGMNFLRQFSRVSVDYGRKELRFELARLLVAQRGLRAGRQPAML